MSTPQTVIIADPDIIVANALRVEFSYRDFVVLLAGSPAEAEDYTRQTLASLVVLDVGTQRLPGYDACARIRRSEGYTRCPIVLTASTVSVPMRQAAEKAGATCLLAKDYSFADLINAVLPHVAAGHPIVRQLAAPGMGQPAQQEWSQPPSFAWRFGSDSRLSRNARLMPVVRAAGTKVPLVKIS
jgi:DNA-binding response OmpR family regulator